MSQRGHKTVLFCVEDSPLHHHAKDVEVVLVNRNKKGFDLKNARNVKRLLQNHQVDFIWFADKRDLSLVAMVKFLMGKNIKTLYLQCMQIGVNKKEFWHTIRFKRIDHWVTPLNYLVAQLKERTKYPIERVVVIHQGLEMQKFIEDIPSKEKARKYFNLRTDDFVVGMIGRIDVAKSPRFVMDNLVELRRKHPQLKMLMVGNKTEGEWDQYYNDIVNDIEMHHQDGSVQLYPFMNDVGYFYATIDVFVMASKRETYGMVTIESMISGNKILGTKSAGTEELLGEGKRGYYFNWMDAVSFKETLKHVINHSEEANAKADVAKEYARKAFSHEVELDQLEALMFNS